MSFHHSDNDDVLAGFGANERALLERVPTLPLRRLAAAMVRAKQRLQFTGWLQYTIPVVPATVLALLAGLLALVGLPRLAAVVGLVPAVLLVVILFDIVTVKLRLRPPERRPPRRDDLDVFALMRSRRSCRSFQTRALSDSDREALMDSVRRHIAQPTLGPSPVRLEYIRGPLTVWPVVNAREFLVAVLPKPYGRRSILDVGRTLQKVVLDATRMGLGTCWIGPGADSTSLQRFLGERFDPERQQVICTCAVGYPSRFVPLFIRIFGRFGRRRLPISELVFTDARLERPAALGEGFAARIEPVLEACRWAPSSYNGQTTRAVLRTDDAGSPAGMDFYAATASRYYAPVAVGIWCANWELGCEALGLSGQLVAGASPEGKLDVPQHDVSWVPGAYTNE